MVITAGYARHSLYAMIVWHACATGQQITVDWFVVYRASPIIANIIDSLLLPLWVSLQSPPTGSLHQACYSVHHGHDASSTVLLTAAKALEHPGTQPCTVGHCSTRSPAVEPYKALQTAARMPYNTHCCASAATKVVCNLHLC